MNPLFHTHNQSSTFPELLKQIFLAQPIFYHHFPSSALRLLRIYTYVFLLYQHIPCRLCSCYVLLVEERRQRETNMIYPLNILPHSLLVIFSLVILLVDI